MLENVKHVILVKSVKGGVGKSTISTQLALSLWDAGYKVELLSPHVAQFWNLPLFVHSLQVGLLDIDLCGPSIPYLLNLENKDGK